jgi:hypothetical protein
MSRCYQRTLHYTYTHSHHALVISAAQSPHITSNNLCHDSSRSHFSRFIPCPPISGCWKVGRQGSDHASRCRSVKLTNRKRGRPYWGTREEDLGSMRFDVQVDLQPLLNSYNTKQLFLYLTATYDDIDASVGHEVVLWDRIITRGDMRDIRAVGKKMPRVKASRRGRGNIRVEQAKNQYHWKSPTGTFR